MKARWTIVDGAFNSDRPIVLFEAPIKDSPRKVFLILDNLGVHHNKRIIPAGSRVGGESLPRG